MREFIQRYYDETMTRARNYGLEVVKNWKIQKADLLGRQWGKNEFLLLFALAIIVGMASKTIAIKTVTIGYQDYTLKNQPHIPLVSTDYLTTGPLCEE